MAQQFTPPQITYTEILRGRSLQYSYPVSQTVWKDVDDVWHVASTPSWEDLTAALIYFTGPAVVDDGTAAELISAGIGTCTPL